MSEICFKFSGTSVMGSIKAYMRNTSFGFTPVFSNSVAKRSAAVLDGVQTKMRLP